MLHGEVVDLDGVVDHQVHRHERVDLLRIAAELGHGVAHGGEVDDGGHAGEVLHQHPGRGEGDLVVRLGVGVPPGHVLHVGCGHRHPVLMAEQVLQQHLHRVRQSGDIEIAQRIEGEDVMGGPGYRQWATGPEAIDRRHGCDASGRVSPAVNALPVDRIRCAAMTEIFEGRRVIELADGIAGPYAALFLADLGADVIKIESATGDPYRDQAGFQSINRNKRSVCDVDRHALLATADVIFTDRPGHAWQLRAVAPHAVIVSVPPWGERGAAVEDYASPSLLAAACGMAWNQQSYTEGPIHLVLPLVSYATGPLAAMAAAAGLLLRERTGAAPTYEVSQVAGAAAFQLEQFRNGDTVEDRPGSAPMGSKGRVPIYRLFRCGDDRWLFMACGTPRFYQRLLELIGREDLATDPRLPTPPWGLVDLGAIAVLAPLLEEIFETKPRETWLRLLRDADIPVQPVQSREQFITSSLAVSNQLTVEIDHPELGVVRVAGRPVRFDRGATVPPGPPRCSASTPRRSAPSWASGPPPARSPPGWPPGITA